MLLLPSWHSIIAATSELGLFVYSITMVCQAAFRLVEPARQNAWFRGTSALAPIGFVLATLILYWAKWTNLRIALPLLTVAIAVYVWNTRSNRHTAGQVRVDVQAGAWLVLYVCAILLMSWVGSFGGSDWIRAPWDSIIVGAIGAVGYAWGVTEAVRFLRSQPASHEPRASWPGAEPGLGEGTGAGPLTDPV